MKAVLDVRVPEHAVDLRFVERWSPRAFAPTPIPREHFQIMFEAARWAPSSMNEQPWSFVVSTDGPGRARLDEAVLPGNRAWSDGAPAIIWVIARTTFGRDGSPNAHALFDTGAATMQMTLQASAMGYHLHAMGGIDVEAAHKALGLAEHERVVCALAIGRRGDRDSLPEPYRAREAPSARRSQEEFVRYA